MSPRFPSLRRHCCFTTVQLAERHFQRAKELISTGKHEDVAAALSPLDTALELCPTSEKALELKARVLLYLKRFKDVVEMLHELLPVKVCQPAAAEHIAAAKETVISSPRQNQGQILLAGLRRSPSNSLKYVRETISLGNLGRKLSYSGLSKTNVPAAAQLGWRHLVLGQACCHLGMMEDAMVLLQSGKKAASAASRRYSNGMRDDNFCSGNSIDTTHSAELDLVNHMLANIKLLLRRRAAAEAALEAGLYAESVRHFSKIIENQRSTPPGYVADCYLHRAIAYQATGRVVDAIADCNRNLALNPRCAKALSLRASLHEMVKSFSECLLDLQQLKMIYEASLRQQSLANSEEHAWTIRQWSSLDMNISGGLDYINSKIMATRRQLCSRTCPLAARTILDLPQHCTMEDVEKAYLLLSLKHSTDKAAQFVQDCARQDGGRDMEAVKEEARASALRLSHLIHKAYTKLLSVISEEEAEEQYERHVRESAALRKWRKSRSRLIDRSEYSDRKEKGQVHLLQCDESSDKYGLAADNEVEVAEFADALDADENHKYSLIGEGVNTEEDLAYNRTNCKEYGSQGLAMLVNSMEGSKNAEDLGRELIVNVDVNDQGSRRLEPEPPCANGNYNEPGHEAPDADEHDDVAAMMGQIKAEIMCNGQAGDSCNSKVVMMVMEAVASAKQSGTVDILEPGSVKMMRTATIDAEPNRHIRSELYRLMNNQGLLCGGGALVSAAVSEALTAMDNNPNLLSAHPHWLRNIQDSLAWNLPQALSVT